LKVIKGIIQILLKEVNYYFIKIFLTLFSKTGHNKYMSYMLPFQQTFFDFLILFK